MLRRLREREGLGAESFYPDLSENRAIRLPESHRHRIVELRVQDVLAQFDVPALRVGEFLDELAPRVGQRSTRDGRMPLHLAHGHLALTLEVVGLALLELVSNALHANQLGIEVHPLKLFRHIDRNVLNRAAV